VPPPKYMLSTNEFFNELPLLWSEYSISENNASKNFSI
jgi:hypothetical protein